jgi:hypothetical protein
MLKVEFDNGEVVEFNNLQEVSNYEKKNDVSFVRVVGAIGK